MADGMNVGWKLAGAVALTGTIAGLTLLSAPLGAQLSTPLPLVTASLRGGDATVLDVGAAVRRIQDALSAAGVAAPGFGPADFALQMVKAPEAIRFTSQTS